MKCPTRATYITKIKGFKTFTLYFSTFNLFGSVCCQQLALNNNFFTTGPIFTQLQKKMP